MKSNKIKHIMITQTSNEKKIIMRTVEVKLKKNYLYLPNDETLKHRKLIEYLSRSDD